MHLNLTLACLISLLTFILEFCRVHISKTKLPMAMKFHGWLQLGVRQAYLATICHSCSACLFNPSMLHVPVIFVVNPNLS